jgi:hypothetical protein
MKEVFVNTLEGKSTLYDLCEFVGVKKKIKYFNHVEKRTKDIKNPFKVITKVFDYGFVFNDGFQIRHVSKGYWNLYPVDVEEIRERIL